MTMKTITGTTTKMMTKMTTNSPMGFFRAGSTAVRAKAGCRVAITALALAVALPASIALLRGADASAQAGPVQRVAEGNVQDKGGAAVNFHFTQLNPDTDYEIWAEHQGARSKSKSISSFDSRKNFNFTLKLGE
jgi:hypothetical protein